MRSGKKVVEKVFYKNQIRVEAHPSFVFIVRLWDMLASKFARTGGTRTLVGKEGATTINR